MTDGTTKNFKLWTDQTKIVVGGEKRGSRNKVSQNLFKDTQKNE
jgi:hypothetical protein